MSSCEKCWADAWLRSRETGVSQTEAYLALIKERESAPCSPKDQAGQWWDEKRGCDTRDLEVE